MKKLRKCVIALFVASVVMVLVYACNTIYFRSAYTNHMKFLHSTNYLRDRLFLKAHMRNGDVWVFETEWTTDPGENYVIGNGILYDFNRSKIDSGAAKVLIDSVAVFETNEKLDDVDNGRVTALTVITGINLGVTTLCIINPKACFGSCPTFYLGKDRNVHNAIAEGFSNAITPSLEYGDIDALGTYRTPGTRLDITMKNEALETHCVRDVKLIAFPVKNGDRIYHDGKKNYYRCNKHVFPTEAVGPEGDIITLVSKEDKRERFSLADQQQLTTRENIDLVFDIEAGGKPLGLVLDFRQTLMTTYFIYSAMGYMGDEVADHFAKLETDPSTNEQLKKGISRELGNIDVLQWDEVNKDWIPCGGFYETGPIAINRQILPLKIRSTPGRQRIRLVMNKGLWRIDRAILTEIDGPADPTILKLQNAFRKGKTDERALERLRDTTQLLITMPGTEIQLRYDLPESDQEYELFLYAKGYYLEWMREAWIKDKNLTMLSKMIREPRAYLNGQTALYKAYERTMEEAFWGSRIETEQTLNDER